MKPDREIVRMYRWSDNISTILDDSNKLTQQSVGTNDTPRDLLHVPITYHLTNETMIQQMLLNHKENNKY